MIDLQNGSTEKDLLDDTTDEEFWIHMNGSYPNVAKVAFCLYLPFVSIYSWKPGFLTILVIKTAHRNRIEFMDDIKCALSETSPLMDKLVKNKQCQTFH